MDSTALNNAKTPNPRLQTHNLPSYLCPVHDIEPYFNWRNLYKSEDDPRSPFYKKKHSEFDYHNKIYNFLIHPQWDEFGSATLYLKLLFVDYTEGYAMIEFIGEWNDAVNNDIMWLKREVLEVLATEGIDKFILIGENVMNLHSSDDCYYEEWFQEVEDGWIAAINFKEHVRQEFGSVNVDYYLNFGGELDTLHWRTLTPQQLFAQVSGVMGRRLGA